MNISEVFIFHFCFLEVHSSIKENKLGMKINVYDREHPHPTHIHMFNEREYTQFTISDFAYGSFSKTLSQSAILKMKDDIKKNKLVFVFVFFL